MNITISIAKDFSDVPWGRIPEDGPFCGENFRKMHLVPKLELLEKNQSLVIDLDGVEGFGSSFLEEAFGGLVRKEGRLQKDLKEKMLIETKQKEFNIYIKLIWKHIEDAGKGQK
jgi:hypothetical protein